MFKNQIEEAIEFAQNDPEGGGYTLMVHFTNGESIEVVLNTRDAPVTTTENNGVERYLACFKTNKPIAINPDHILYVTVEW